MASRPGLQERAANGRGTIGAVELFRLVAAGGHGGGQVDWNAWKGMIVFVAWAGKRLDAVRSALQTRPTRSVFSNDKSFAS